MLLLRESKWQFVSTTISYINISGRGIGFERWNGHGFFIGLFIEYVSITCESYTIFSNMLCVNHNQIRPENARESDKRP